MATINSIIVEAIVIGSVDYKESSKILKVFSKELGIISVMARGAKRPNSKMQNLTSIFTIAKLELVKRNDFYYLDDGQIISINEHLRIDIKNIYSAELCIQFVEKTLMEAQIDKYIYLLLIKTIKFLGETDHKNRLISMFIIKYMSMIGFRPQLNTCVICGKKNNPELGFSMEYGGITCLNHSITYDYLQQDEYNYLIWLMYSKIDSVNELKIEINEKMICKYLINFFIKKTEINKPTVLEAYHRFMLD